MRRAKAVAVWTWRRALRDHGPRDALSLLLLLTLSTWMDRDGRAFPSQEKLAAGARMSIRTVRRKLAAAVDAGWLRIETENVGGQNWRRNVYLAAVPEGLELDETDEALRDVVVSQAGDVDNGEASKREVTIVASPSETCGQALQDVRSPGAEGEAKTPRGEVTAVADKLFNSTLHGMRQQEGRLAPTALAEQLSTERGRRIEPVVDVEANRKRQLEGLRAKRSAT